MQRVNISIREINLIKGEKHGKEKKEFNDTG